jgi:hypothetical protein
MPDDCTSFTMHGVREHSEGYPVDLCRDPASGRLTIRARNEGGNNITQVDLLDLIDWLRLGPPDGRIEGVGFCFNNTASGSQPSGAKQEKAILSRE